MTSVDVIVLVITLLCLISFCGVFTILFNHYYKSNINLINSGKEDIDLIDNAIYEENQSKNKFSKVIKIITKIVSSIVLVVIVAIFSISLINKVKDDGIIFGNSTLMVIASDSMSKKNNDIVSSNSSLNNQFNTYDIIGISKYSNQDEVKLYDVVAFKNKNNVTIVHRIVKINIDEQTKEVTYLTQGDSNLYPDNTSGSQYIGYLSYDKIIGKYNGTRIQGLGIFVIFLQSPAGIVTIISLVYCLIMYDYLSNKYKKAIVDRTNVLIDLIDYDLNKEHVDDVITSYNETLIYKDQLYSFKDGKFLGKEKNNLEYKKLNDYMVFIKKVNGSITLTVLNTNTNISKTYSNLTENDLDNLENYVENDSEVK